MTLSPEERARLIADQQRVNFEQIDRHAKDVMDTRVPLITGSVHTDWRSALTRRGKCFVGDERNISLALRLAPELVGLLRFNEFSGRIEVTRKPPWRQFSDEVTWDSGDDTGLKIFLQERNIDCRSTTAVAESVELIAREKRWHPLRNRLLSLDWDGTERIKVWLQSYLHATDDACYLKDVGTAWLIGAVARVLSPGAQVDHVLTLVGKQGDGKSETARLLALDPEFFLGDLPDLRTKDSQLILRGRWIAEIAELAALRRVDLEAVKAFVTQRADTYRPPFGRRTITVARQTVFIATTNQHHFLRDRTGNRRWWPISVGKVDLPRLRRDVELLWAEAVHLFQTGHPWHLTGEALERAETAQERRVELTEIDLSVKAYLDGLTADSTTSRAVLVNALHLDPTSSTFAEQSRRIGSEVARAIAGAGWEFLDRKGHARDRTYVRKR